ncbi:MAG: electron transport complex subunit RsxD, partial [Candidatus Thioglobus sp.]
MMMHSNALNTNQIMRQVIYALVLGIGAAYYFFGWGVILQITLAVVTAVVVESTFLSLRKLPVKPAISDGSAILSAILLAISIPSIAPWWIV